MREGAASEPGGLMLSDVAALFEDCPDRERPRMPWPHSPFAYWLARCRQTWCVAGSGPAYDEVRALILEAGRSYELSHGAPGAADLLIVDGPWEPDASDPARWRGLLADGAIVLVHGLHPGYPGSSLWRAWRHQQPDAPFYCLPGGAGLGLIVWGDASAPAAVRALCALPAQAAAVFEEACTAASARWTAARREHEALLRLAHAKRQVASLQRSAAAVEAEAAQLQQAAAVADALRERLAAIEGSTTWRLARAMQRAVYRLPRPVRTTGRRVCRTIWWTLRGRLRETWRGRRAERLPVAAGLADTRSSAASAAPGGTTPGHRDITWRRWPRLDHRRSPLLRVAIGYVAGDAGLGTLRRAVDSARLALEALGQGDDKRLMVAAEEFAMPVESSLPGVLPVPSRGEPGAASAHNRMMSLAFADGADVYVAANPQGLFDADALAALVRMLRAHGWRALVEAAAQPQTGKPVNEHDFSVPWASPFCLAISRAVHDEIGGFDEQMDLAAAAVDLSLRSSLTGIPVLQAIDARYHMLPGGAAPRSSPPPGAVASAWILARKWHQDILAEHLAGRLQNLRYTLPPDPARSDTAPGSVDLTAWWDLQEHACALKSGPPGIPRPVRKAVLPPDELDACLVVPFGYSFGPVASPPVRAAALIHLFYEDLAEETRSYVDNVPVPFDLLITTDTDEKRLRIEHVFSGWRRGLVEVHVVPNRGNDIAPRLDRLCDAHARYDVLLYLHGKKSLHWQHGRAWREYLYRTLLGSPDIVRSVLDAFTSQPMLGLVFPQHWDLVRPALDWGRSFEDARDLATRMDIDLLPDQPLDFPSGSMFWARTAALRPLLDLGLTADDFEETAGDGVNLAHAIERLFPRICERSGHTWIKIGQRALLPGAHGLHDVRDPADLSRLRRELSYLLSDPALRRDTRTPDGYVERAPFRFRPEEGRHPRWTLLASGRSEQSSGTALEHPSVDWLRRLPGTEKAGADVRTVAIGPRPPGGVPPPLDVRASEVFFAADEDSATCALPLIAIQRAFFGTGHPLRRVTPAPLAGGWPDAREDSWPSRPGTVIGPGAPEFNP